MSEAEPEGPLSLGEALATWCPHWLVTFVADAEKRFSVESLAQVRRPVLSKVRFSFSSTNWFRPTSRDEHSVRYEGIWQQLLADFRRRLEREEIMLIGVQTKPTEQEVRSRIPGLWATDLELTSSKALSPVSIVGTLRCKLGEVVCRRLQHQMGCRRRFLRGRSPKAMSASSPTKRYC